MTRRLSLCLAFLVAPGLQARGDEPTKPTAPASEANPAVPAAGHSLHGEAFNDGPRQAAKLIEGMGKAPFPITTDKPDAQAFMDQGVAQLHTFYYLEAERSFRQVAKIDPACPMAYWGMAMANTNNTKRAEGFMKEARKRAEKATTSARERRYLDALSAFYKDGADAKARRQGLLLGLETIVQEHPDDLNAKVWLAMVTWQNSSKGDGIGSRQAVEGLLAEVLRVEPMHPGAHHYRIHLWDHSKPTMALKSAALYGKAAPGIAHAWHMPGHTYTELKRYADAAYQQEASARVDHAALAMHRVMPFEIHNYSHNNQWLCTSLSHIGKVREAITIARNLVEEPRDPKQNGPNDGGSCQREGRARWSELLVRYELWDDLIEATTSGALDWSNTPIEKKEKAFTLGLAYAAKGDKAKLAEQVAALKALADGEASKKSKKSKKSGDLAGVEKALAELEGHQMLLDGDKDGAFKQFAKATGMRGEALARAYLSVNNLELAESTAKKAVDRALNQVAPLAEYVEVLHIAGKDKEAQIAYRKLEPLAKEADRDLPIFQRLAPIVDAWKAAGDWTPVAVEPETDDAAQNRIDLTTLGPLTWSPYAAEPLSAPDTQGAPWTLADHKCKNVVLLFYLGGQCAHCMQQLELFGKEVEAFRKLGTEVVAVSTDDVEATKVLNENEDDIKFPMPLLSDPGLTLFKAYRSFDDFEDQPLHGTFLIDGAGKVRFQKISADPFLEVEFLKGEAERVNRLTR
ncbi:MAG: peroxiredoxin family protein [Isosphaeraceae bacterium]